MPDGPRAQSRMGALLVRAADRARGRDSRRSSTTPAATATCSACCRDLLGAAAAGLRNLLIITGDPPKMGPYPDATAVFDIDAIGLTNLVARLNHGLDPGRQPDRRARPDSCIGVGVNPAAPDLERELVALRLEGGGGRRVRGHAAGVRPARSSSASSQRVEQFRIPIIAGIWPLVSLRNAEFLANEVPGVRCPTRSLDRMRRGERRGQGGGAAEGVRIAREMLAAVRGRVQGVQVAAPLGRVPVALEVLEAAPIEPSRVEVSPCHLDARRRSTLLRSPSHAGPPQRRPALTSLLRRRRAVPRRGAGVRRDRGAAARP